MISLELGVQIGLSALLGGAGTALLLIVAQWITGRADVPKGVLVVIWVVFSALSFPVVVALMRFGSGLTS